ncbi:class I SAM-dependent methyltransferase [Phreatobacter sp.]|uniref:class I SAM-dependent methyltransferase n=1 Tax=Phreatobacter sp. TaxID=1966341 RepID=UPI003F72BEC3
MAETTEREQQRREALPGFAVAHLAPTTEAGAALRDVHAVLSRTLPAGTLKVYEAGGGSTSYLPEDVAARADYTVIDIDADQLKANLYADDLILGDIQTYRFAEPRFDLVVCYNVVEHLPNVAAAFAGFQSAVKPGGLILIGAPHPRSLSGVVTRFTPHWFHVWFCRHVMGWKNAGKPGQPPFPTFFHPLVDPDRLAAHAASLGFEIVHNRVYESPRYPELRLKRPLFAGLLDTFAKVLNVLPGIRGDVRHGDYHLILRAKAPR